MGEQPRTRTPIDEWSASSYLVYNYELLTGEQMSKNLAELMMAQIWIETAQGKSMFNYNVGNLSGAYNGNYWRPPWYEVTEDSKERYKQLHQLMLENKVPNKFQAYPDFDTGFQQYIKLYLKDRYLPLLDAGKSGDAYEFASAIFHTGYCPDDPHCRPENTYKTIESFQNKFREMGLLDYDTIDDDSKGIGIGIFIPIAALGGLVFLLARK